MKDTKKFLKAALIRAARTVCQSATSIIGVCAVMTDVNWIEVVSSSILSGLASFLTSIITGLPEVDESTGSSFVKATVVRAVRTICQTAISLLGVCTALSEINWIEIGSAALLSGVLSVLTSISTGLPEVEDSNA